MRCIVTGGAGFIGSHLATRLIKAKHEVLVVDNLSTGKTENIPAAAEFLEADINNVESLASIKGFNPDVIFHLAAQISVRNSVADPTYDGQTNILGTLNMAQIGISCAIQKFIFISTGGAIYGEQQSFPADENHPVAPESPYGLSKYCAEKYLNYLYRKEQLPYLVLRLANIYGPRQDPHGEAGVVAIFSQRMLANETPRINGDGLQTRDFVYVGDVAAAALCALKSNIDNGVFNIGTGKETDINTLAAIIQKHAAYTGEITHGPELPGEQKRSVIASSLAEKQLNWRPQTDLDAGLAKTVAWFKQKVS